MGVTLERVQNKFACIIGELCSEPVILSQFAIWVDLRIAEYKAKGAISLDCSGSTPYPTWLKGLEPPKPAQSDESLQLNESLISSRNARHRVPRAPETVTGQHSHPDFSYSHSNIQTRAHVDRLINDFNGVIKQEPVETENVFPVSLHSHHNGALSHANSLQRSFSEHSETYSVRVHGHDRTQPLIQHSRKRISAEKDVFHSNNNVFPSSWPPKSRRLCSNSDNNFQIPPCVRTMNQDSNQSLLSVIGIDDTANTSSASKSLPVEKNARGDNSIQTVQSSGSIHTDSFLNSIGEEGAVPVNLPTHDEPLISENTQLNARTSTNMRSATIIFQKWLYKHHGKAPSIEQIPAFELDDYLTQFFSTIKQHDGRDYSIQSFMSLRKRLARYLTLQGYPQSLLTSGKFSGSKEAFQNRILQLRGGDHRNIQTE